MDMNFQNLMKEAQKMQQRMQDAQQELSALEVTGVSGGGLVEVVMDGRHDIKDVKIKPAAADDPDLLGPLVAAACNDANRKIEAASKKKISELTAGLNLPTDLMGGDKS